MAEQLVKCLFCVNPSKYSCPQCSMRYCSVECYKCEKHLECSENFYKEQVMKELRGMQGTPEDKRKMLEMLSKLNKQEQSSNANERSSDLSERLSGISLDDAQHVWGKLTDQEKNMFQKRIDSGNLDFIEIWTPWWSSSESPKIEVVTEKKGKAFSTKSPKIVKDLPSLQEILHSRKPDENLKYSILEILLVYTCIQRLFNGDLYDSPSEAIDVLFQLSKVLQKNTVYSDVETCVVSIISNVKNETDITVDPVSVCLADLGLLLKSNDSFVMRALSDLYTFLKRCRKLIKSENKKLSESLYKTYKKVYFFIIFAQEHEKDVRLLYSEVLVIQHRLLKEKEEIDSQKKEIETHLQKLRPSERPLIQEM